MLIKVDIEGMQELRASLADLSDRRLNAAVATALTRTAVQVRQTVLGSMSSMLDRPTPYTMKQLRYVAAKADQLVSAVGFNVVSVTDEGGKRIGFKDLGPGETPAGNYLQPQIEGGARRAKRFERALQVSGNMPVGWFAVPGTGANLDAYGNMSTGQIVQILSQLRVQLVAGSSRNMSFNERKQINAQRKAGGRYFVIQPGTKGAAPGVYQREFLSRHITPVLLFTKKATYRKRFDFADITRREAETRLPKELDAAIVDQLVRLQATRG